MPLSDRYKVKADKIISDKEMETKIKNGKESKFNKALKQFNKTNQIGVYQKRVQKIIRR
jgi:hypothetical protein